MSDKKTEFILNELENEVSAETNANAVVKRKARNKKRDATVMLGLVITIFAIIGLVVSVTVVVRGVINLFDNTSKIAEYENFVYPVVMYDPVPFESVANAEQTMLLQTTMWSTMLNRELSKYNVDDFNFLIIPASDLDVEAAKLYGPDVKLEHQTFGDYEVSYVYDEELNSYHVQLTAQNQTYTPRIEEIVTNPDQTISLKVGYVPPTMIWNKNEESPDEQKADKYMTYVLMPRDKSYYLYAIREIKTDAAPQS